MSANPLVPNHIGELKYPALSNVETGITAFAGGGQTSATKLTAQSNIVSVVASANDSVKLPKIIQTPDQFGSVGTIIFVGNADAADSMQVYGAAPDTINAVATGTGVAVASGVNVWFVAVGYTQSTDVGLWRMTNSQAAAVAAITSGTIAGVTINSSVIGGSAPAAGTFTDLTSTGNTTVGNGATDLLAITGLTTATRSTSSASETVTLSVLDTRTGAGATGWAAKFDLESNVALGAYANAVYGYLAFGASGAVTGLAAGVCGEIVMSAGCAAGTYAALELEMGMPAGAVTGTATSFMYISLYGAAAATFDTSGYLFQLAGYTKAGGKFVQDTTSGSTIRPVQVIKVKTLDGDRYLPLYSTAAIAA